MGAPSDPGGQAALNPATSSCESASLGSAQAAPQPPAKEPIAELSKEQLAALSKEERKAYHAARRAQELEKKQAAGEAQTTNKQLTKAERRAIQEAQRNAIAEKKNKSAEGEEFLKELMMQGLSEEQAREVMFQIEKGEVVDDGPDDDDEVEEDLLASVRRWMNENSSCTANADVLRDFNLTVRFQGHVETTPPDHLGAILSVIAGDACGGCDMAALKLQPNSVAKTATGIMQKWSYMIEQLYNKIGDSLTAIDVVVNSLHEGVQLACASASDANKNTALVGLLMGLREGVEGIEDDDMLAGLRRFEPKSVVMSKFIEFLEEALEDSEDNSGDD